MECEIVRSNRRTISAEIKDGQIIVRAPKRAKESEIKAFLERHRSWLEKHSQKALENKTKASEIGILSGDDLSHIRALANEYLPKRTRYLADQMGVSYGKLTLRLTKTRWGSCSSKGNINLNILLMLTPPEVIDSVIVHELCHIKHMDHSKDFYKEVYKHFPEYDSRNKWLKENGEAILYRLKG